VKGLGTFFWKEKGLGTWSTLCDFIYGFKDKHVLEIQFRMEGTNIDTKMIKE